MEFYLGLTCIIKKDEVINYVMLLHASDVPSQESISNHTNNANKTIIDLRNTSKAINQKIFNEVQCNIVKTIT